MSEVFLVTRTKGGINIQIETNTTAAARRLLIDAAHSMNSLDDVASYSDPSQATAAASSSAGDAPTDPTTVNVAAAAGDQAAQAIASTN